MFVETETWTIFRANDSRYMINPTPSYQRGPVWSDGKRALLIDSIFRGYDIPKFYLRRVSGGDQFKYEVVDGQQRLRAIWGYLDDAFALPELEGVGELPDGVVKKRWSELAEDQKERFGLFQLSITVLAEDTDQLEVQELFLRLQEGVSLNPAEKRNAMIGPVRDFAADLGENHPVFPLLGLPRRRYGFHELAALALLLELNGPTDLRSASLKQMYQNRTFDIGGDIAHEVRDSLDFLHEGVAEFSREVRTRWGFIDLYLAIRSLKGSGSLASTSSTDVLLHHIDFERRRREASGNLDASVSGDVFGLSDFDDMERYAIAFGREGADRSNVRTRHNIYMTSLDEYLNNVKASSTPIPEP